MRLLLFLCALTTPFQAHAASFQRPIPNPQTATAEGWFLAASVSLLLALAAVQWLVTRR